MQLIDTHCHIDVADFAYDYQQVLVRSAAVGVSDLIVPAVDQSGWPRLLEVCRNERGCHAALGLHPLYLAHHRPSHLDELAGSLANGEAVAVGEVGLDFFVEATEADHRRQQQLFEEQARLAKRYSLPLLLHARKAHDQVLALLRRLRFSHGGIVHAFSGSRQQAERYLDLGFCIGVGGTITYQRAQRVRAVIASLPLASLVLETDAPDIPTAAHRHERNSPEYLPEILASLAAVRDEPAETVAAATTANARRVLRFQS